MGESRRSWSRHLDRMIQEGSWPSVCQGILYEDKAFSISYLHPLPRDVGLPEGRPGAALARSAARSLREGDQGSDRIARARRVIATFSVKLAPALGVGGDKQEGWEALDAGLAAHAASDSLMDGPLTAWAAVHVSYSHEFLGHDAEALDWAEQALAALERTDTGLLSDLLMVPDRHQTLLRGRLEFHARQRQFAALRMLRRPSVAERELNAYVDQKLAPFSRDADLPPTAEEAFMAARAVRLQAANWRRLCNRPMARSASRRLRELASDPRLGLQRQAFTLEMETAEYGRDWRSVERIARQRLAFDLENCTRDMGLPRESSVDEVLAALQSRELRDRLAALGNDWFEIAKAIRESEDVSDPGRRAEARELAGLAGLAWKKFAHNGRIAIEYHNLLLDRVDGHVTPAEFGRRAISVSRRTRRAATQVKAAFTAARFGEPGDADVLGRLEELHDRFQGLDQALVKGLLALWWTRTGDMLAATSLQEAVSAWHRAVTFGTAAGRDLLVDGVIADQEVYVWAWQSAAISEDALLGHRDPATRRADVLTALMHCVSGIGRLYATSTTRHMQETVVRDHGKVFLRAAALCTELRDAGAMTVLMETARRDRVGLLLHDLAAHPARNEEVAAAAAEILATLNTRVLDEDVIGLGARAPEGPDTRATALRDHLVHTVEVSERVIGPLAALADPDAVAAGGPEDLLTPGSAVLQLFPGHRWRRESDDSDMVRVHRVVHWWSTSGTRSADVDQVDVPRALLDLPRGRAAHGSGYRQLVNRAGDRLLPPRLVEVLVGSGEGPVRLDVVPTGMLHIPFDALTIPGWPGLRLIDRAVVTLHGSVTGALALRAAAAAAPADPVAVYDRNLHHAGPELAAMKLHFPATRDYTALGLLDAAMTQAQRSADSVFAAGVHGVRGSDGWSHGLVLPDGGTLTAAHVLRWSVPRLAALPSCEMSIRDDSGEIAGLPYAMMLRGATTVVGTLDEVHDESTGEIMQKFWRHLDGGRSSTSVALRSAKLEWLSEDPSRRRQLWRWAWLVNYGTH